jgi:hypothetical protein
VNQLRGTAPEEGRTDVQMVTNSFSAEPERPLQRSLKPTIGPYPRTPESMFKDHNPHLLRSTLILSSNQCLCLTSTFFSFTTKLLVQVYMYCPYTPFIATEKYQNMVKRDGEWILTVPVYRVN